MSNFKEDILEAAGEPIEAIVIGAFGWDGYEEHVPPRVPDEKKGVVLSWDEAAPMLNYEYDTGFGTPECHAIEAYTASRVIIVSTYDGSTSLTWVWRNPTPGNPSMPGGG
jgi:hypothetical protein